MCVCVGAPSGRRAATGSIRHIILIRLTGGKRSPSLVYFRLYTEVTVTSLKFCSLCAVCTLKSTAPSTDCMKPFPLFTQLHERFRCLVSYRTAQSEKGFTFSVAAVHHDRIFLKRNSRLFLADSAKQGL